LDSSGTSLTIDQYFERERVLRNTPYSQQAHSFYVLVPEDNLDTTDILAHCEVYEHPALLALASGVPQDIKCMSIGSVFCPSEHRGKGYARKMMSLLYEELEENPEVHASTLYSDIGPVFYDRIGWKTMSSKEVVIAVQPTWQVPTNIQPITNKAEIDKLVTQDNILIHEEMLNQAQPAFCVLPTPEKIHWIQRRSQFYCEQLGHANIEILGAHVPGTDSYVTYFHNFTEKSMYFLRMRSDSNQTTKAFIALAQREALRYNFEKIILWDVPAMQGLGEQQTIVEQREESISALTVFNHITNVSWLYNEKFAWV
jgi:predicted GNAT family acetyltransferase